jgi:hypothetical protein
MRGTYEVKSVGLCFFNVVLCATDEGFPCTVHISLMAGS